MAAKCDQLSNPDPYRVNARSHNTLNKKTVMFNVTVTLFKAKFMSTMIVITTLTVLQAHNFLMHAKDGCSFQHSGLFDKVGDSQAKCRLCSKYLA